MSRIYDALKKLEAERAKRSAGKNGETNGGEGAKGQAQAAGGSGTSGNGHGNGHGGTNGYGNGRGDGNGSGNGHGNGYRTKANGNGQNGHGNGSNGHGNGSNGHGNGNGKNGHGNGKRRGWRWLFQGSNGHSRLAGTPAIHYQLQPDAEDAYQRLGTNLLISGAGDQGQPRLMALTAARHGEGTTTTAAVLSSILTRRRGGRVAVVEANLRSPGFESVFGIKRNGGFAELVTGEQSLAEVAQPTSIPGLFAIGCGATAMTPSSLFDSAGVVPALEQLKQHFDFVIFDTPPVNVYGDSQILCPHLDAAVLVIEADRTRMPDVERARRTLDRAGVHLAGSVLNRRRSYIPAVIEELL